MTENIDISEEVQWNPTPEDELKWATERNEELIERINLLETSLKAALYSNEESGLVAHAKRELELAGMLNSENLEPDPEDPTGMFNDYNNMMGEAVLELVRVFSSQGHSGFSAGLTAQMFNEVANYKTLSPNDHSINRDVSEYQDNPEGTNLQCMRDSRWFSDDSGATWYTVETEDLGEVRC